MAYARQKTWVDNTAQQVDAAWLNTTEQALVDLYGVTPATNGALVWDGSKFTAANKIANAQIDAAAAIARSKLDFGSGLVNADIAAAAAIAKSKLAALGIVNADVDAAAAIALSKINVGGGIADVVKGDGSVGRLSEFRVAGTYDLLSSTTESSMISGAASSGTTGWQIPANQLGVSGAFRFTMLLDYLNATGAGANITIKLKFGGTTMIGNLNAPGALTRSPALFVGVLANIGATNSQVVHTLWPIFAVAAGTLSVAGTFAPGGNQVQAAGTAAVDTTAAQYFDITAQHGTNSANLSIRRHFASLEVI